MKSTSKALVLLAPAAALGAVALAFPGSASAAKATTSYQAVLKPLNNQPASGTLTLQLNGNTATISEHASGLASTFKGAPFPHVQHIHGGAIGTCPTMSADKNGDGVINTVEGKTTYGGIQTTLSVKGDTSPKAGTNVKIAPGGSSFDYSRTISLDAATMKSIKSGIAVIVVHGDDPTKLSKKAQGEKSELVPSLPLAATSPALCGPLTAMQMGSVPGGPPQTGGGSTAGIEDEPLLIAGGALLVAAGGVLLLRRRYGHN